MTTTKTSLLIAMTLGLAMACGVQAATITAAGTDLTGTTLWDTAGYGDDFYAFAVEDSQSFTTGGDNADDYSISYDAAGSSITTVSGTTPANMEIVGTVGVNFDFGLGAGEFGDNFTLTFNTAQPAGVTIAILVGAHEINANEGTLGAGVNVRDIPQDIKVSGDNTVTVSTGGPEAFTTTRPDWYFFTVTDIEADDMLVVTSTHVDDSAGNKFNPVNGVGVTAIPEPATMAMIGLGGLAMLRRRSAQLIRRRA